ncbi:uncharacterized protein LOC135837363 [Planococcus citri]|uniref:uncharacterized protein LOC135837363 n=1 Tax=Planococcus citri TaxID=170843 RepID=UPI0031F97AFC
MNNSESTNVMNFQETETDETGSSSTVSFQINEASILRKDFDILKNMGKGAYAAAVYKVRNKLDVKLYAIKVIPCEELNEEMPKEVEFLSVLNHPNVVRYCTAWTDGAKKKEYYDKDSESSDDFVKFERESEKSDVTAKDISPTSTDSNNHCICMFIQMEFCKTTLANVIKGTIDGPLSPDGDKELHKNLDRILRLITHIVKGLAYIHDKGIIHRDLKPENILIDGDDFAKIGDFGLATWNHALTDGKASHTGKVATPLYDAPELGTVCSGSSNAHYNEKVDMYSLGIIIYEMCCPRFETAMERKEVLSDLRNNPIHIPQFELPKGLSKLIRELLDHDSKGRPSAAEILKNGCLVFDEIDMNPNTFSVAKILPSPVASKINLVEAMKGKARKIFELHGGYSFPHGLPMPSCYQYSVENSAIHSKTYCFFENLTGASNTMYTRARFDMVSPDSTYANFAMTVEALEIAYEFLDSFSGWVNTSDFVIRLTDSKIISALATLQKDYENLKVWSVFRNVKRLINIFKSRKIKCPILVAPKLHEVYHLSETVFQIVSIDKVLASGDRYRLPVKCGSDSANQFIKQQSVIGVTIYVTRFIDILESKNIFLSKFDVFIGSVYCNQLIEEKLDLAKKLRDVGIRCTPSYTNYRNIRAIKKYVEKTKIHYAVILEKNKLERNRQVALYSRISGNCYQEEDIPLENIVPHLRKSIEQSNMMQFLSS